MRSSIAPERVTGKRAHAMVACLVSKSWMEIMRAASPKARHEAVATISADTLTA
jgi:hypothetical protein